MHPPERHWPFDATRLEILAFRAGLDADELCEWLRVRTGAQPRAATGRVEAPPRFAPRAGAVRFVELRGDSAEDLAAAVAALG